MRGTGGGWGETLKEFENRIAPIIHALDEACEAEERVPSSLERTLDLYTVIPEGFDRESGDDGGLDMEQPISGASQAIAERILAIGRLGFEEVRCDVYPKTAAAIAAMEPVVAAVHRG